MKDDFAEEIAEAEELGRQAAEEGWLANELDALWRRRDPRRLGSAPSREERPTAQQRMTGATGHTGPTDYTGPTYQNVIWSEREHYEKLRTAAKK